VHESIILTAQFDEKADALFQDLRRRHFPPEINFVPAHLTLFHSLPPEQEDRIMREAARLALKLSPFEVAVGGPMRLGRGVALRVESDELMNLRQALAERFDDWLVRQDREKFRPHVTIQNKVAPHVADALFDHLQATLPAFKATAEGLQLWRYGDGRWTPIAAVPFQARAS
jgi:2'-5' RNA ligase